MLTSLAASLLLLAASPLRARAMRTSAQLPILPGFDSELDDYTIFKHASMPNQQLRFKQNDGWCTGADTRSWSGYLDSEDSHYFFYYYESRSKPEEDPVVLWINGGPWVLSVGSPKV